MFIKKYLVDVNSVSQNDFDNLLKTLPIYRQNKINEYKFEKDKILSLLAGITLKKAFSDFGYTDLDEKILFTNEGKPYLPSEYNFYFSISHSNNKVLVVVSNHDIGCDIEYIKDKDNINLAKRYFTSNESAYLINNKNNKELFYKMWTIKEAYLKAIGKGLLNPLNSFEVNMDSLSLSNDEYIVYESYIDDEYSIAIVTRK